MPRPTTSVLLLLCVACTGNGGAGSRLLPELVTLVVPAPESVAVAQDASVRVRFLEAIETLSGAEPGIALENAHGPVPTTLTQSADRFEVVLTPRAPFGLEERVTAVVTTAVRTLSGRSLNQDFRWSFTTRAGDWSAPSALGQVGRSTRPALALDSAGNALVVTGLESWSSSAGTGSWIAADPVPLPGYTDGSIRLLSFAADGTALAGCEAVANGSRHALVVRKPALAAWSAPDPVGLSSICCSSMTFASSTEGHLLAKVHACQTGPTLCRDNLHWAEPTTAANATWYPLALVFLGQFPWREMACDSLGRVFEVQLEVGVGVAAQRHEPKAGTSTRWALDARPTTGVTHLAIGASDAGTAVALVGRSDEGIGSLTAYRHDDDRGFASTQELWSGPGTLRNLCSASAGNGAACVVGEVAGPGTGSTLLAQAYDPGRGSWKTGIVLTTNALPANYLGTALSTYFAVAIAPSGDALVVWVEPGAEPEHRELFARRVPLARDPTPPRVVTSFVGTLPRDLQATLDDAGRATVVWTLTDDQVFAARLW